MMQKTATRDALIEQLGHIVSEGQNPDTLDIDLLDTHALLVKLNQEDFKVPQAVKAALPQIVQAVDTIVDALKSGGRLFYIGAGTSGRLGVLDAVECPPTFSVSHELVQGVLAGGEKAMFKAVEGAEDNGDLAIQDLRGRELSARDVVVGIAASGRTPYAIAGVEYAASLGCRTIGISCSPDSALGQASHIDIAVVVGPEALTGSTRMKSGSAQKMVLNMLTTASMIRLGKSYRNLMVDVNASNEKLRARAVRIVMQATDCDKHAANEALAEADNNAKLAILLVLTGVGAEQGKKMLQQANGFLRQAVESNGR